MIGSRLWVANLDADLELAKPNGYQTSTALLRQMAEQKVRLAGLTLGEPLLEIGAGATAPAGFFRTLSSSSKRPVDEGVVVCWCPTPSALRQIRALGIRPPAAPSLEVLCAVNDRRFQMSWAAPELERVFVEPGDDDDTQSPSGSARGWRYKRPHGWAGRGQRVIEGARSADDERWLRASRRTGYLRERHVQVIDEWCQHGYVDAEELLVGSPTRQICDRFGRVEQIMRERPELDYARALERAVVDVGEALRERGYFGPFGVDGFSYLTRAGCAFNPISDINARFTLGWSIGMGEIRERALSRLHHQGR
jgi:hypothetical protein